MKKLLTISAFLTMPALKAFGVINWPWLVCFLPIIVVVLLVLIGIKYMRVN